MDSSALVKLVRTEAETPTLRRWLATRRWVISDLHRTELRRAARRTGGAAGERSERLLAELDMVRLTVDRFDGAGRIAPADLRSLDALHLAGAQALGEDLAGIVCYDQRLREAAQQLGIDVAAP